MYRLKRISDNAIISEHTKYEDAKAQLQSQAADGPLTLEEMVIIDDAGLPIIESQG